LSENCIPLFLCGFRHASKATVWRGLVIALRLCVTASGLHLRGRLASCIGWGILCRLHYSTCLRLLLRWDCVDLVFVPRVKKIKKPVTGCCMVAHLHHDLVGDGFGNRMLAASQGTGRVHHDHTTVSYHPLWVHALNTRHKPSLFQQQQQPASHTVTQIRGRFSCSFTLFTAPCARFFNCSMCSFLG
jgi:hypothetical protein